MRPFPSYLVLRFLENRQRPSNHRLPSNRSVQPFVQLSSVCRRLRLESVVGWRNVRVPVADCMCAHAILRAVVSIVLVVTTTISDARQKAEIAEFSARARKDKTMGRSESRAVRRKLLRGGEHASMQQQQSMNRTQTVFRGIILPLKSSACLSEYPFSGITWSTHFFLSKAVERPLNWRRKESSDV